MPDDGTGPPGADLLILALSARALATAARAGGYSPVAVDFWMDQDTRRASRIAYRMGGHWRRGFRRSTLMPLVDVLARTARPLGVLCGTGFEDRPGILAALAARHTLLGNDAAAVRRVKRPASLAALCRDLGIAHPELAMAPPAGDGWLRKRAGGSGGGHVALADGRSPGCGWYWQRRVAGEAVSALFLADGRRALVLGFSAQWTDPAPGAPFRYGGAVRPAPPGPHEATMVRAVERLAARAALRGLNSADFLVGEDGCCMIEINPRPGASLDVFAHPSLLRLHVAACRGQLPEAPPAFAGAMAARLVYAPAPLRLAHGFSWPDWTVDRDTRRHVPPADPLCTVLAEADTAAGARVLAEARAHDILSRAAAA